MLPIEFNCKETQNCTGKQQQFMYMEQNGVKSAQYKCDTCYMYVRIIDGNIVSMGKYNGAEFGIKEMKYYEED